MEKFENIRHFFFQAGLKALLRLFLRRLDIDIDIDIDIYCIII
jgi:hypothetical protein